VTLSPTGSVQEASRCDEREIEKPYSLCTSHFVRGMRERQKRWRTRVLCPFLSLHPGLWKLQSRQEISYIIWWTLSCPGFHSEQKTAGKGTPMWDMGINSWLGREVPAGGSQVGREVPTCPITTMRSWSVGLPPGPLWRSDMAPCRDDMANCLAMLLRACAEARRGEPGNTTQFQSEPRAWPGYG
jgi:hypothetical protein